MSSGAPPVKSSVLTEVAWLSSSRHLSAILLLMTSVLRGEDSTWQCLHAWLQYKPMLSWNVVVGCLLRGETPAAAQVAAKESMPRASNDRWRWVCSFLVRVAWPSLDTWAWRAWSSSSLWRDSSVSGMREGSGEEVQLQMAVEERFKVGLDCRAAWRGCCGSLDVMVECIMTSNSSELCQVEIWEMQIQPNNHRERVHKHFNQLPAV